VIVLDNLCNSHAAALSASPGSPAARGLREGRCPRHGALSRSSRAPVRRSDHFAGLKAVGESAKSRSILRQQRAGRAVVCRAMAEASVGTLVFSSSATV